jgi:hypothetical protein
MQMKDPRWRDFYMRLEFDEPCPDEHMLGRHDGRYICHVLREIYQKTNDPDIKLLCRKATTMSRKMTIMLREFGVGWPDLYALVKRNDNV